MIYEEKKRLEHLHNYIIIAHILCIFFLVGIIIIKLDLTLLDAHVFVNYFFLLLVFFLVESIILYYFKDNFNKNIVVEMIYIIFPLAIAMCILFLGGERFLDIKYVLLAPILIAGSTKGKKTGAIFAFISTIVVMISYGIQHEVFDFAIVVESNFILICMMFLVGWFSGAVFDIELNYRNYLSNAASTDHLTGLYNHRYLQEKLRLCFEKEKQAPLSFVMIDVDNFKEYNDIYGHLEGDNILSIIGNIIRENISGESFSARYGGDEFAIVLPGVDSSQAFQVADNIREKVDEYSFNYHDCNYVKITISCGIASRFTHADTRKEIIKKADQALYKAKSISNNRVEIYSSIFEDLIQTAEEEEVNLINSFQTLLRVINAKDRYTYGHSERVMEYCFEVGSKLNLNNEDLDLLRYAAFLHDIGKIEIDRSLLNKPSSLTDEEFEIFKNHSRWGSEIIKEVPQLNKTAEIILYHHENYDGSGYPEGLCKEEIPILSRIIRIADSYDAMTTSRPYRKAMSIQEAVEEIKRGTGTLYDPALVESFIVVISNNENAEYI